ncbi:hypothetical protein [Streptomyces ziwulingensis]|uniref:Uncharacterized protein n=1 Tax=Streptomyces ziwulingensis TaxID=1045501 RepID=A0ABP9D126_9ACTN
MGSLQATLCAGAALTAALLPATAFAGDDAGDDGRVSVTPAAPAPGTDVTLRVAGCTERTAVAVSAAFVSDAELSLASTDGALVGSSRVRAPLKAGAYTVEVRCGPTAREGTLTVTAPEDTGDRTGERAPERTNSDERAPARAESGESAPEPADTGERAPARTDGVTHESPAEPEPQSEPEPDRDLAPARNRPVAAHASPIAPVAAGGGGTALAAGDDAQADGPGTAHAVTGLVLAGVAAVAVALRSARRSRGTD